MSLLLLLLLLLPRQARLQAHLLIVAAGEILDSLMDG